MGWICRQLGRMLAREKCDKSKGIVLMGFMGVSDTSAHGLSLRVMLLYNDSQRSRWCCLGLQRLALVTGSQDWYSGLSPI